MQSSVADGSPALLTTRPLPAPSIGELPEAQTTDTHSAQEEALMTQVSRYQLAFHPTPIF